MEKPPHFRAAKVLMGPLRELIDPNNGSIIPVIDSQIITINGQIWKRIFLAFGCNEERIRGEWDQHPEKFIQSTPQ